MTPIHLILDIKSNAFTSSIGDTVVSYDEARDQFTKSVVGKVIIHDGRSYAMNDYTKDPLIKLSINMNEKIVATEVTENHPYFDPLSKSYKQIREFKIGDVIKTIEGNGIIVGKEILIDKNSSRKKQSTTVYNLMMAEGPNNYIVNGAVVHNDK